MKGMQKLVSEIKKLKKSHVKNIVDARIREFKKSKNIFSELCFCILTANYSALGALRIQKEIGNGFLFLPEKILAARLKQLGHRFPNARAKYILKARKYSSVLKEKIFSESPREWLVKNIVGLGYKEASHFLRNVGKLDYAIIDFHILDLLEKYRIIKKPKNLNKKKYLEIEQVLKTISKKTETRLGELDLYLWYMETGKVLK